jgi:hypothetical protein
MPSTERFYAQADEARDELSALDRKIAEAKESMRDALQRLGNLTRVEDSDGRCFGTILEAVDDLMSDARDEIRDRITEADIAIDNAEFADIRRSSPVW